MHARTVPGLVLAVALAALVLAPAASAGPAATPGHSGSVNPVCTIVVDVVVPGQHAVCKAEASATANVTVPGYPGPCIQAYPYSELCNDTTVGAEAHVEGHGHAEACVAADHLVEVCGPELVTPQEPALP